VKRTLVAIHVGVVGVASACSIFGPDPDRLDSASGTATPTKDAAAEAGPARACVPARPPGPPSNAPSSGSGTPFFTVFKSIELLDPDDPRGFDLDDRCTCPEPASCTGDKNGNACDTDGGIDNKFGQALRDIPGASSVANPQALGQHFASGASNIILYVAKYDGAADDDDVDVYLVRSTGTPPVDGGPTPPRFDGNDPFDCVSDDAVRCDQGALTPSVKPEHGYVRGGTLVVPDANFVLSVIAGYPIRGHGALTAKLETFPAGTDGTPRFALKSGIVAGALPLGDLYTALALVELSPGQSICKNPSALAFLKNQLCVSRDSTFVPTGDAGASCDAVSAAFAFEAVPFVPHAPATLPLVTPCAAAAELQCD
jgi:hypothetical protein